MAEYGYIRVSSRDQNEARQRIALREFGIPERNLFIDKQSGKDFDRPQYKRLLRRIQPEDLIVVKSIDRLGRNYDEILSQWRILTKQRHTDIVVLDMPLLDTRQRDRSLTGTFIADLVLQILSYVAETERDNTKQRQAEGIAAAHLRGVRFGAPKKPIPDHFPAVRRQWTEGAISARAAARALGVATQTFQRWCAAEPEPERTGPGR